MVFFRDAGGKEATTHEIGSDKQLFLDRRFIEWSDGVQLVVNQPVKRAGAVLRADLPWDQFALGWYSIVDDDGTYEMWYYGAERDPRPTNIAGATASLGHLTDYAVNDFQGPGVDAEH